MTMTDDYPNTDTPGLASVPELPEPPPPSGTICTFVGCDQVATVMYGPKALQLKKANRCETHGPASNPAMQKKAGEGGNGRPPGFGEPKAARKGSLEQRLAGTIGLVGTVVYALDTFDGQQILIRGDTLAKALDHLAAENPAVKRVLEAMMTGGAWGEVVMVIAPMAVAILAHHGVIPEQYASFANIGVG